jgi:hypothetical protein
MGDFDARRTGPVAAGSEREVRCGLILSFLSMPRSEMPRSPPVPFTIHGALAAAVLACCLDAPAAAVEDQPVSAQITHVGATVRISRSPASWRQRRIVARSPCERGRLCGG